MRQEQFEIAIAGVPRYYAVFKVREVSDWVEGDLAIGDLMYWNSFRAQMVRVKNSMCLPIEPECLDFVSYMTFTEMQRCA